MRLVQTTADTAIREALDNRKSFSVIAGAGSGKTTSLIGALGYLREREGDHLRRNGQSIVCITYTNRAVNVISSRLDWDNLFQVSTLHSFLWRQISGFTSSIKDALHDHIIPALIEKKQEDDNGGESKKAVAARERIASLTKDLEQVSEVQRFEYNEANFSDYGEGQLGHDDVVDVAAYLISTNENIRKIMGQKYPYIFVDEAQDTFLNVIDALNLLCGKEGLPIVGYFGDPMQQIYDKRAGGFQGPDGSIPINKEENFRCSTSVIELLNAFRKDIKQFAAGNNADIGGTVEIRLVRAEDGEGARKRYTDDQVERAAQKFDEAIEFWGWNALSEMKQLFLVRQMIARRLGFVELHRLFTGQYASSRAKEDYEKGEHFLLSPFIESIVPLVKASQEGDLRKTVDVLRQSSPAFDPRGDNARRPLGEIVDRANQLTASLMEKWGGHTLGDLLRFCEEEGLCKISRKLSYHLGREPREESFDPVVNEEEKGDWLVDAFLAMPTAEMVPYVEFVSDNTPFSTQHGVKGEEYKNVLVVFDDTDAAWRKYSFTKTLTPRTSGAPTEGQLDRSTKLCYVCFSRAEENLRILLFTANPDEAKAELLRIGLFEDNQISISN